MLFYVTKDREKWGGFSVKFLIDSGTWRFVSVEAWKDAEICSRRHETAYLRAIFRLLGGVRSLICRKRRKVHRKRFNYPLARSFAWPWLRNGELMVVNYSAENQPSPERCTLFCLGLLWLFWRKTCRFYCERISLHSKEFFMLSGMNVMA